MDPKLAALLRRLASHDQKNGDSLAIVRGVDQFITDSGVHAMEVAKTRNMEDFTNGKADADIALAWHTAQESYQKVMHLLATASHD